MLFDYRGQLKAIADKLDDALKIPHCPYCLRRLEDKVDSLIRAVQALSEKIDSMAASQAAIDDLTAQLKAGADTLKQAVEANQPK